MLYFRVVANNYITEMVQLRCLCFSAGRQELVLSRNATESTESGGAEERKTNVAA
jgi:hypothetical protein